MGASTLEEGSSLTPPLSFSAQNKKRRSVDHRAAVAVRLGGIGVVVAVLFIASFLFYEVFPITKSADLGESETEVELTAPALAYGVEPFGEALWSLDEKGNLHYVQIEGQLYLGSRQVLPLQQGEIAVAAKTSSDQRWLTAATSRGRLYGVELAFEFEYDEDLNRTHSLADGTVHELIGEVGEAPLVDFAAIYEEEKVVVAALLTDGKVLRGSGEEVEDFLTGEFVFEFSTSIFESSERLQAIGMLEKGRLLTVTDSGRLMVWSQGGDLESELQLESNAPVTASYSLLGYGSILISFENGDLRRFLLSKEKDRPIRIKETQSFSEKLPNIRSFSTSGRQRVFFALLPERMVLGQGTTSDILRQFEAPSNWRSLMLSPREDYLLVEEEGNNISLHPIDLKYPQVSFASLFGRLQYEGLEKPSYTWQSTGGSQQYEPKISLVPLIVGTLKGTLWSLLPSIPLGILGALYTARFLRGRSRELIKAFIELLSGVPSVILGFVGALYLAPAIQNRFLALALLPMVLTTLTLGIGFWSSRLSPTRRRWFSQGKALLILAPVYILISWFVLRIGPALEELIFGRPLREWAPAVFGVTFEMRNSVVVGLAMGFAVTPLIFTLAEDAFRNVPRQLVEASSALGATPWQTARKIIMPYARPGVIAAIMLGLGRAVGETMIVLMATGNTAITSWNPLQGFRALSANLAVELPEAPYGGFLYRTLFLSALLLFLFTFVLNTFAEYLRSRNKQQV